ncbi:hypothetical protein [Micromonospora sp. KC213]|nr:hypothetical protein [Micromonospora sp. KC213]
MRLGKVLAASAMAAMSATVGVVVATASPAQAAATIDPERYSAAPAGFG